MHVPLDLHGEELSSEHQAGLAVPPPEAACLRVGIEGSRRVLVEADGEDEVVVAGPDRPVGHGQRAPASGTAIVDIDEGQASQAEVAHERVRAPGCHAAAEGALDVGPADPASARARRTAWAPCARPDTPHGGQTSGCLFRRRQRPPRTPIYWVLTGSKAKVRPARRCRRGEAGRRSALMSAPISRRPASACTRRDSTSTVPVPSSAASSTYRLRTARTGHRRRMAAWARRPGWSRSTAGQCRRVAPCASPVPCTGDSDCWLGNVVVPQATHVPAIRRGRSGQLNSPSSTGIAVTSGHFRPAATEPAPFRCPAARTMPGVPGRQTAPAARAGM